MEHEQGAPPAEAKVVTLCGSTRFEAEFAEVGQRLTREGCVVISLEMFHLPDLPGYDWTVDSAGIRQRLGDLHLEKVRMADEVFVVDPGGYVGESTRREIAYAESLGTPVRYLSREPAPRGWFSYRPLVGADPTDTGSAVEVRAVRLRADTYAGPFWDDEDHLGDDFDELHGWLGISRGLYDDVMAWSRDGTGRVEELVARLRAEVRPGIEVRDPGTR